MIGKITQSEICMQRVAIPGKEVTQEQLVPLGSPSPCGPCGAMATDNPVPPALDGQNLTEDDSSLSLLLQGAYVLDRETG